MSEIKEKMIQASKDLRFRNELLCNSILGAINDEQTMFVCESAEWIIRNGGRCDNFGKGPYEIYLSLCREANSIERFIRLVKYLKKINHYYLFEENNEDRCESAFRARQESVNYLLSRLRPLVLEYVSEWSEERRLADSEKEEFAPYFKEWYK